MSLNKMRTEAVLQQMLFLWLSSCSAIAIAGCRDPTRQPFASSSYWNTPIGTGAKYVPAGVNQKGFLFDSTSVVNFHNDPEFQWVLDDSDPLVAFFSQGGWNRNNLSAIDATVKNTSTIIGPYSGVLLPMDASMVTNRFNQENNCVAFVLPGKRWVLETQPIARYPGRNFATTA